MKKTLLIILSTIIYVIILWMLIGLSVGINFAVFNRGAGGITALGSIVSFWISYKFVKWLWNNYLYKTN